MTQATYESVEVVLADKALPSEELLSNLNNEMERIFNEIEDAEDATE